MQKSTAKSLITSIAKLNKIINLNLQLKKIKENIIFTSFWLNAELFVEFCMKTL